MLLFYAFITGVLGEKPMSAKKKVAFITIGQSPRTDILPEMLPYIGDGIEPVEVGALDGLSREEIDAMAPQGDEPRLVTLLRDGSEVVISRAKTRDRLEKLMEELDGEDCFLQVLLCTGHFENLRPRTLLVESQRVADAMVEAICFEGQSVGVMVPHEKQMNEYLLHDKFPGRRVMASHASPYSKDRLTEAAGALKEADLVVMHCMGYTEAMQRQVARVTGKPVLLARRMAANAVAQLV